LHIRAWYLRAITAISALDDGGRYFRVSRCAGSFCNAAFILALI
jgi:hypothetical protein